MAVIVHLYPVDLDLSPSFPATTPTGATNFFDSAPGTGRIVRTIALITSAAIAGQLNGSVVSTTPQGWWPVLWERLAKPFPAKLQIDNRDTWLGNVPTPFVGNAWMATWDGPARKLFPASAQQVTQWGPQGDLVSTPQGWPIAWPERFAKPCSPVLQQVESWPRQGTIVSITPQGWPATYPDRFAKPFPISLQLLNGDQWIGNVPTVFVGNAWVVHWDGPPRASFPARAQQYAPWQPMGNVPSPTTPQGWPAVFPERFAFKFHQKLQRAAQPVLAAYGTVIVTYPDGWQTEATPRFAVPLPPSRQQYEARAWPTIVSTTPQGYEAQVPILFAKPFPAKVQQVTAFPQYQVATAFVGNAWIVTADQIATKKRPAGETGIGQVQAAGIVSGWEAQSPVAARKAGVFPSDAAWPPEGAAVQVRSYDEWPRAGLSKRAPFVQDAPFPSNIPPPVASPGNTDLWSYVDFRFRVIRPPPPDFDRKVKLFPRIASQPTLSGVSTAPTLRGESTAPTLLGISTNPSLTGEV